MAFSEENTLFQLHDLCHIDGNHKLIRYARYITLFYRLGIKSTSPYCFSIKPHTGFYKIIHCGDS